MPVGIIQPSNRINLTNVSVVRLRKSKARFELACYKNKLLEYRSGTETNLDNVLQVPTVFLSVSKGEAAPQALLAKAFGKSTGQDEMIAEILKKGEIQVGAGERKEERERVEKEVLEIVGSRLVDPGSKRVYTTGMIRKALEVLSAQGGHAPQQDSLGHRLGKMNLGEGGGTTHMKTGSRIEGSPLSGSGGGTPTTDTSDFGLENGERGGGGGGGKGGNKHGGKKSDMPMWTGVVTTKSAKSQALEAMKALIAWQPIPVMRARMRLRISCPSSIAKQPAKSKAVTTTATSSPNTTTNPPDQSAKGTIKDRILAFFDQVESQDVIMGEEWEVIGFVEPGAFKGLGEFVGGETKGRGRVEVLDMAVTHEDEA